jgi:hypothetical protein
MRQAITRSVGLHKDVAEFAIQSLDHPAARNAVLELGGSQRSAHWRLLRFLKS